MKDSEAFELLNEVVGESCDCDGLYREALVHFTEAAKHLRAVKILDAWLAKRGNYSWTVERFRGEYFMRMADNLESCEDEPHHTTPALARIAAADALANEDPSLLEGIES